MANSSDGTRKALARRLARLRKVLVLGGMALAAACAGMQKGGGTDPGSARGNQGSSSGGGAGGW